MTSGEQTRCMFRAPLQLSDAQELIQNKGIENWVSEMQIGYHNFITLSDNIQRERWVMLAGAVLGIATSMLLFNTYE